ncbi:MAG: radical SAM protein [Deltaproteobacteria bacterium]|nr:radical SAM protein [Deltaproteobacteria bacterium]
MIATRPQNTAARADSGPGLALPQGWFGLTIRVVVSDGSTILPRIAVLLANAPTRIPTGNGRERFFVKSGSRWPFSIEKAVNEPCRYVPFPFGLAYLAALLDRDGVDVAVYDGVALNAGAEALLDYAGTCRPQIVFMETTTPTVDHDLALCLELKARTGAVIALAGAHATTFAEAILSEHPEVDWILTGEYELNAQRAIEAWRAGGERALAGLAGLVHAQALPDGTRRIVAGPPGAPIEPLDLLPVPARHFFPTREAPSVWPYWDGFCRHRPAIQMHASRGCPFRCTFCLWVSVMYGNGAYRTFSPRRVVDEMEQVIRQYGAKEIYFDDDIFTAREVHVLGICDEIRARQVRVPWSVMGDAMAVTERAIRAMAHAGCIGMKLGIESANRQVLEQARKPIRLDKVRDVVGWCSREGIKTHATITFGLPGETHASMQETLDFCRMLSVDSIQFSVATPFPGTPYYEGARRDGRLLDARWSDFDGNRSAVVRHEGLSAEEIAKFAARAPSRWLRARLHDPPWLRRQARYLGEILADQGVAGVSRRILRAARLLLARPG